MKTLWTLIFGLVAMVTSLNAGTQDGLIAYYPFDGNANDASGNNQHGSNHTGIVAFEPFAPVKAGQWPSQGKRGQAAWFDGLSCIGLPQPRLLEGASNATITAWVWFANPKAGHIIAQGDGYGTRHIISTLFDSQEGIAADVRFAHVDYGQTPGLIGFDNWEPIQGLLVGRWIMITLVLEAKSPGCLFRCYLDSELIKEVTNPYFAHIAYPVGPGFNGTTLIGAVDARAPASFWRGCIDELRIYDRPLTKTEIVELFYDGTNPNTTIEVSQMRICWSTPTNKTSQLQYRSEFTAGQWVNLGLPVVGENKTTCVTDEVDGPKRFYRVIYQP